MMDEEILRQVMRQVRAISCNAIQHIAAHEAGTLSGEALRWSESFLTIANTADQALAEHGGHVPPSQRGFGT